MPAKLIKALNKVSFYAKHATSRVKPPVAAFSRHIICFWLESFYKLFIVLVVTIR